LARPRLGLGRWRGGPGGPLLLRRLQLPAGAPVRVDPLRLADPLGEALLL